MVGSISLWPSLWGVVCLVGAVGVVWYAVPMSSVEATPSDRVGSDTPESVQRGDAQRVSVSVVEAAPKHERRWFYAVSRSVDAVGASFVAGGRVLRVGVQEGDRVEAGQEVARLDEAPIRNGIAGAQAEVRALRKTYAQAQRDVVRVVGLVERGGASGEEAEQRRASRDALKDRLSGAQSRVRELRRQLGESVLRAPCAGVVSRVGVEAGEVIGGGQPVVWVHGEQAEVEVRVPVSMLSGLRVQQKVEVRLPLAGDALLEGVVDSVVEATQRVGLFPVIVRLPNAALAGVTASVALPKALPEGAWLVPVQALVRADGFQSSVFVVRDGKAARVDVMPHTLLDEGAVVRAKGLRSGDRVVTAGHIGLVDGARVAAEVE